MKPLIYSIRSILDFVSPRQCRICGNRLAPSEDEICSNCHWQLPRTGYQRTPLDNPMARLFWGRFRVENVAAWMHYQPENPQCNILIDIKYHGAEELAYSMGHIIAKEFSQENFFEGIDIIVPVPLTTKRKFQRGFNQAEKIGEGISEFTGIPITNRVLKRVKFVDSQTHLNDMERAENVRNAFELIDGKPVAGKHVLIVDDVVTTGATISACAEQLSKAGDVRISVLTIGVTK